MDDLFKKIPKNKNIFFHCRLKNLRNSQKDYKLLSKKILEILKKRKPKSIIIPTYTYSFRKNKTFNTELSPSETGRFSEEIRNLFGMKFRTLDPIFSHLILFNKKEFLDNKISSNAFDQKSLFFKFVQKGGVIVNFNLEDIVTPLFHLLEFKYKVPYRQNRIFKGMIIRNKSKIKIKYSFFSKKKRNSIVISRKKILKDLKRYKIVNQIKKGKLKLLWFYSAEFNKFISQKLKSDPNYLIN